MTAPSPVDPGRLGPALLVSVRDAAEAEAACLAGADLVDAKDPDRGALAALSPDAVVAILARVGGRAATSAVAGEPADEAALAACVAAMARTRVGYVKVAVGPSLREAGGALAHAAAQAPGRLVAVLFAEDAVSDGGIREGTLARLAAAGFAGAMVDTALKDGRRLTDHLPLPALAAFAASCRGMGLISGLAGSLRLADIPVLAEARPGYLGFRGGLCHAGDRRAGLDPARLASAVRALRPSLGRDAA